MNVFGPQFGTRNDELIFYMDDGARNIKNSWYSNVKWKYLDEAGSECEDMDVYLICDNGYVHDPLMICPFTQFDATTLKRDISQLILRVLEKMWSACLGY